MMLQRRQGGQTHSDDRHNCQSSPRPVKVAPARQRRIPRHAGTAIGSRSRSRSIPGTVAHQETPCAGGNISNWSQDHGFGDLPAHSRPFAESSEAATCRQYMDKLPLVGGSSRNSTTSRDLRVSQKWHMQCAQQIGPSAGL